MQHRDLIDRAVDRAGLDPHDVRHRARRRASWSAPRSDGGVDAAASGFEVAARRRAVVVVDARRDRAVRVERLAERFAGQQLEALGLADERLLVGPGEHRAGNRMVHHRQPGAAIFSLAGCNGDGIGSSLEPADQPGHRVVVPVSMECRSNVRAIQSDARVIERHGPGHRDSHEHIATADHIGSSRQRFDLEWVIRRAGRHPGGEGE